MDKIGILYICTGRYSIYWNDFYASVKDDFLYDTEKFFFIWTDDKEILQKNGKENIRTFEQMPEKWPFPTLKRFEYFLRAEEELENMDYLIYMNGNLRVNQRIEKREMLPMESEGLFVTLHPGFFAAPPQKYTYESNPDSSAYVPPGKGKYYFAGGLNGGRSREYLIMMHCLKERIEDDLSRGIIAKWHDESQLNGYMYDYREPFKMLSPAYLYPEGWELPFEERITVRDKNKAGGHNYLRNCTE